jgi:hypothetical protein
MSNGTVADMAIFAGRFYDDLIHNRLQHSYRSAEVAASVRQ